MPQLHLRIAESHRLDSCLHWDMAIARYVYWQDGSQWLGYFEEFPDYWTQGETFEDLSAMLQELYRDLTSGEIPGVRRVAELQIQ